MKKYITITLSTLTLLTCFTGCGDKKESKKTVDINKYVDCSFSGVDSKGICNINIDYDKMVEDNYRAFGLKRDYSENEKADVIKELKSAIQGDISTSDFLSNGDNIEFIWIDKNFDKVEDDFSIDLKYSNIDLSVSGLDEVVEIDPFENVNVTFSGKAPNGTMNMEVIQKPSLPGESTYTFHYNYDKNSGLKNGDVVTISIEDTDDDIERSGYSAKQRSKEYTVEGLDFYAEKFADIPKADIEVMDQHNRDLLDSHIANKWADEEKCKNVELTNYYFLTAKDGISVSTENYLYFIYKIDVENPEGAKSYYYYTFYPDILITSDNKCVYDLNKALYPDGGTYLNSSTYGEAFTMGKYYYTGYEKIENLYNKHVTTKIAEYECEEVEAD